MKEKTTTKSVSQKFKNRPTNIKNLCKILHRFLYIQIYNTTLHTREEK